MKDLKDMCIINKNVLRKWNQTPLVDYEDDVEKALNQDLSGMVVVPIIPTEDMLKKVTFHPVIASDVYKAMLSAAKEKNDE